MSVITQHFSESAVGRTPPLSLHLPPSPSSLWDKCGWVALIVSPWSYQAQRQCFLRQGLEALPLICLLMHIFHGLQRAIQEEFIWFRFPWSCRDFSCLGFILSECKANKRGGNFNCSHCMWWVFALYYFYLKSSYSTNSSVNRHSKSLNNNATIHPGSRVLVSFYLEAGEVVTLHSVPGHVTSYCVTSFDLTS